MTVDVTAIDGQAVGPTEAIHVLIDGDAEYGMSAGTTWYSRTGQSPAFHGQTPELRSIPLVIVPGSGISSSSLADWVSSAMALFRPTGALRTITATRDGTSVSIEAAISGPVLPSGEVARLRTVALAPSQFWRAATQSTTSLTVTNDGNAPANPKFTIKPSTGTVVRRRVAFAETTGEGLVNHPLQLSVTTTGASATTGANYYVFSGGKPALFQIVTPNGSSKIYIRKSLAPSGSDYLDVVFGSAVSNTITANQLPPWGMDWAHASFSNTVWVYRATADTLNGVAAPAMWDYATAPKIPGVWTIDGSSVMIGNGSYTLTTTLNTQIRTIAADALFGVNVNAILTVPQGSALYRVRNATTWSAAVLSGTGSGVSYDLDPVDVPAALDLALSATGPNGDFGQWSTHPTDTPIEVRLESADVPTITVDGSSTTMARINGRLRNTTTGDYVDLRDLYIDSDAAGGLVIDTLAGGVEKLRVYPSLSTSPMYTGSGGQGWAFSNPAGMPLAPGANTLVWNAVGTSSGSGDGSPTITTVFSDTWV